MSHTVLRGSDPFSNLILITDTDGTTVLTPVLQMGNKQRVREVKLPVPGSR